MMCDRNYQLHALLFLWYFKKKRVRTQWHDIRLLWRMNDRETFAYLEKKKIQREKRKMNIWPQFSHNETLLSSQLFLNMVEPRHVSFTIESYIQTARIGRVWLTIDIVLVDKLNDGGLELGNFIRTMQSFTHNDHEVVGVLAFASLDGFLYFFRGFLDVQSMEINFVGGSTFIFN